MSSKLIKKYMNLVESADVPMNEAQSVKVIVYNSGVGDRLEVVSKDPKRHREAEMVAMQLSPSGTPEMKVKLDGDTYIADWNSQHGWVVDFD